MITVMTGAGISTASGIPDYRGPQGLWRSDPDYQKLVTIDYYLTDPAIRRKSWEFRRGSPAWQARPNDAHRALVDLEKSGRLDALITQNVDGLHQSAGSDPARVLELHGNMFGVLCVGCGERSTLREALDRIDAGDPDPACRSCGDILKTTTVMFGEPLEPATIARAVEAAETCEVFVAIGTTLQVQPAASLAGIAAEAGATLIIVNADPTPYDRLAAEVIRTPIPEAVPALVTRLLT
ncbi:SIR2 family NAD-dependent protein deacylase [Bailinhaonella thermotolerans]|uniref:protein acetyllysine N-acetyltransferase n=1 Tax=Bailinhaonella thermotolerans TaxID=1070861 RepID=A0A3A4A7C6_9ACTN|nr:Sir2 family NAD-dependent protein deacetylase [Bailinhaonella thermotolerans]RJL24485.1 NAD-dependent deacetylase [Bailinhaonella thermotolerans]